MSACEYYFHYYYTSNGKKASYTRKKGDNTATILFNN